jgi:hypothetical protein
MEAEYSNHFVMHGQKDRQTAMQLLRSKDPASISPAYHIGVVASRRRGLKSSRGARNSNYKSVSRLTHLASLNAEVENNHVYEVR